MGGWTAVSAKYCLKTQSCPRLSDSLNENKNPLALQRFNATAFKGEEYALYPFLAPRALDNMQSNRRESHPSTREGNKGNCPTRDTIPMRGPFEDYSWKTSNLGGKENYPDRSFNSEKGLEGLVIVLFAAATPTLSQDY